MAKNFFCQQCAAKPGWEWKPEVAFQHSCQRCFRNLPCNDYAYRFAPVNASPAPAPKDLVKTQINSQSECTLPRAKGSEPPPAQPVYEVPPPEVKEPEAPAAEAPVAPPSPTTHLPQEDGKNEIDALLDATQPKRPGIKLETKKK